MNYKISFREMDQLGMEMLSKQSQVSLEEKRNQFQTLKKQSSAKAKKQKS
jgi:hypothetical protein